MQAEKLTQIAASEILEVSRSRASDLVNAKVCGGAGLQFGGNFATI